MNWIDILILFFLVIGALSGFIKGLFVSLATLIGIILGVCLSMKYSYHLDEPLKNILAFDEKIISYISMFLVFMFVLILVVLIGKMFTKLMEAISLGTFNKILGMLFGLLKCSVIISVFILVINAFNMKLNFIPKETIRESKFYEPMLSIAQNVYNQLSNTIN